MGDGWDARLADAFRDCPETRALVTCDLVVLRPCELCPELPMWLLNDGDDVLALWERTESFAAACGFGAGTVARLIIHPLDVVKKRFQVAGLARSLRYGERVAPAAYANFASAFGAILKKEGVAGFYKGLLPGVIKSAPASAITFAVYEATMVALSAMNAGER